MAKSKEKKIKRLRKARIWPSVLFLIFSIIISCLAFVEFLTTSMMIMVQERFTQICDEAEKISSVIDPASGAGELTQEKLHAFIGFTDAVYVLDKDKETVVGYGEMGFDISDKPMTLEDPLSGKTNKLYSDKKFENNLFGEDGSLHVNELLNEENIPKYFEWMEDGGRPDLNKPIFEAVFWTENAIDGGSVLVRCRVPLYFRDFFRSGLMAIIGFGIMLLPTVFFFINILVSVHNQRRMTKLIYTDAVTGGKSYVYFEHEAGKKLRSFSYYNKMMVIADITILKYRSYCSFHGARAGEALLESVDKTISTHLEKGEICAYYGKSSFALLLKCTDRENGEGKVRMILGDLTEKYSHAGLVFHAGVFFSEPDKQNPSNRITDPADCFNRASAARGTASDENAPVCVIYDDKLLEEQLWEHKVEEKMQAALENEEFKVYIQPKYDPATEKLAGAEALVRWINAEDGFISPGRFIPIFEKNGFITKLDDYMLSHVAKLQAQWLAAGKEIVPISVNVSRAHFANPDLAQHICTLVDQYNVPHHFIEIELTESAFFDDKAALLRTVHQLRELGFEISMDDFGAGYSSLNSLKDLPLDVLKLDAEFFRGESEENRGEIVVSQAIRLAKSLNMRIVAEGVEKKEQVDFLAGQGCDMIQGFYFAKPMPADEYEQRL